MVRGLVIIAGARVWGHIQVFNGQDKINKANMQEEGSSNESDTALTVPKRSALVDLRMIQNCHLIYYTSHCVKWSLLLIFLSLITPKKMICLQILYTVLTLESSEHSGIVSIEETDPVSSDQADPVTAEQTSAVNVEQSVLVSVEHNDVVIGELSSTESYEPTFPM